MPPRFAKINQPDSGSTCGGKKISWLYVKRDIYLSTFLIIGKNNKFSCHAPHFRRDGGDRKQYLNYEFVNQ